MLFQLNVLPLRKIISLSKKKYFCLAVGIILCIISLKVIFSYQQETLLLHDAGYSAVRIKKNIAAELKDVLLNRDEEKPTREVDENAITEHKRHLLSNPDLNKHRIKRQKEIVFNNTALNKYIDILLHKEAPATTLRLINHSLPEYPSAGASVFMQDLPYRWRSGSYLLTPWKVKKRFSSKPPLKHECFRPPQDHWSMIALVKSWVINQDIRNAIRETWGNVKSVQGVEIHVVFLLANAATTSWKTRIEDENNKYGDILQIDSAEKLKFFTVRTVSGMAWVSNHFPSDFLYSSLDDNMVPSLHKLIPLVDNIMRRFPALTEEKCLTKFVFPFLCGYMLRVRDEPTRDSRHPWCLSKEIYPPNVFPPHCQGGFYSTSVSTVNLLVDSATKTYPSHFDALWVTGILRQKLGLGSDSITDLTKAEKDLVCYLDKDIVESIKKKWTVEEASFKNLKLVYRTE